MAQVYLWALPPVTVRFRISVSTDRGLVRAVNEDSFLAVPPIFVVADGMGGHAFGDRASQTAARVLHNELNTELPLRPSAVLKAIQEANARVQLIGDEEFAGTTLAGVALVRDDDDAPPHWMVFNIGDSRVYLWNDDELTQLSIDHSAVQELVDSGVISSVEAMKHADRNIVTRAVGVADDVDADVWFLPGGGRQCFLICSDGLTKEVGDDVIRTVLATAGPSESPAELLVAAALAAGGSDNVTVVVVEAELSRDDASPDHNVVVPQRLEETLPRMGAAS